MSDVEMLGSILVIDDEPINLLVLQGVLGHAGYRIHSATNGSDGLSLAQTLRPDLVLLDVMLPGETGFEICRKLQGNPVTAHIPVIFVTSLGELSDKLTGLDLGAVDYITKPFLVAEVLARVRSQMNFIRRQGAIIDAQAGRLNQVQTAQLSLLPLPGLLPEAKFSVQFLPVLEAGGDFYDVLSFGQDSAVYFLADVSGHDLGASFITSSLKALFCQHAKQDASPAVILAEMNTVLCDITADEVYLTAVCLVVDRKKGCYSLSSAGHPPVVAHLAGEAQCLDLAGSPLGMFEEIELGLLQGQVSAGDRFYLYTDGLAENSGKFATSESFRNQLLDSCLRTAAAPLESAVVAMFEDMMSTQKPVDDVVLLGVDV